MTFIDLIVFLILFGFVWFGFWYGFIYSLGGFCALFFGTLFASRSCVSLGHIISPLIGDRENIAIILAFILIFAIVRLVVHILFKLIGRVFNLPILNMANRLLGAVLGLGEGAILLGLILYLSSQFPLTQNWLLTLSNSFSVPILIKVGQILLPLIPEAIKNVKTIL
jgi:membrane protein required for colicin V production